MSESESHPPTPSPSLPLPPGPDPSEGAMALEPRACPALPSCRRPIFQAPVDSGDGSSIISEVSGSGDNRGDGGLEDGASARRRRRTGSGRDGDGDGGCGPDSDMVAGAGTAGAKEWN
ncbi:hypothetical protein E4U52_007846 [Claviceps spartinae]|nr:hypothetical protein E4U52_007846 [Claviceps spartinae]